MEHSCAKNMHIYLTKTKLKILLLYLLAYALLWFGYARFVVPVYGHTGFVWAPNMIKVFESIVMLVFFALSLPSKIKLPSDFLIHVHFLLPVVPMLALYSASDLPRVYIYFVLLAFAVVCWVRKFKVPKIKGEMIPVPIMMWGLLIIVGIYILSIIVKGGLQYFNLNLLKVYDFRSIAAQNLPQIYGYFSPMVSKVLLPFIVLLAVYRRKWLVAGLALTGSVMMFAMTNHKGPLFYPFLVLGIYYVLHYQLRVIQLLLIGYIFFILAPLAFFYVDNSSIILGALFLFRVYFVPAQINFNYYDFFSTHPHTMLAESKLTFGLVHYPYDLDSTHLIGYYYSHNAMIAANTGWLGSGYMQFGLVGMLGYALIIGLLLSIVDTLAKRRELDISVAILFIPFFSLFLSSDLPTAMLTGGLLLALFLTWTCQLRGQRRSVPRGSVASFLKRTVRRCCYRRLESSS